MANTYVNKVQLADGTSLIDISDTTAVASDVAQGKYFYLPSGEKVAGTSTGGGGGSVTQDQDGFIVLPPDGGSSPSGGGLEYEEGTWSPASDTDNATIQFSNPHTTAPMMVNIVDTDPSTMGSSSSNYYGCFINAFSNWAAMSPGTFYGVSRRQYTGGSGANSTFTSSSAVSNYVTSTQFSPQGVVTGVYWRAGRTYKWIAVWAPTT